MSRLKTLIGCGYAQKVVTATMNLVNLLAAGLGLTIATLGFHFYRELELPQGMDDMEHMMFSALSLGFFGLIIAFATLSGSYWLNKGSSQYKIAFCGVIAVVAYVLMTIRSALPHIEKGINEGMMAEYVEYFRNKISRGIVNNVQKTYECCGYFGIEDFPEHRIVPNTCCAPATIKRFGHCSRETAFMDPCRSKLGEVVDVYFNWMSALCYVTSIILIGLTFTVILVVCFSKSKFLDNSRRKFQ